MDKRRVVISGMGVVSPYGIGTKPFFDGICSGSSCAARLEEPEFKGLPTRFAASLKGDETELNEHVKNKKILKTLSRAGKMAIIAAQEALENAGIDFSSVNPYRVGTSMGAGGVGLWDIGHSRHLLKTLLLSKSMDGAVDFDYASAWSKVLENVHPFTPLCCLSNVPTAQIAIMANARGNCHTTTTACTSSAQAIGEAFRQVQSGVADIVIAGGSDSMINPYGLVAFSMLGVLSTNNEQWNTASRPFDRRRDGFMVGEGAAVFVLETYEHCRKRGGDIYAELSGYCSTNDAYRLTDEPPDGRGSIAAIRGALDNAKCNPTDVDYVNVHGTGTKMNDKIETIAIKSAFGDHAWKLSLSSTKSMVGHLVAAAGCIEFAACLLALRHQVAPPTINYEEPDPECDLDYIPNIAREQKIDCVLSNSFGFGGQNACLVINKV